MLGVGDQHQKEALTTRNSAFNAEETAIYNSYCYKFNCCRILCGKCLGKNPSNGNFPENTHLGHLGHLAVDGMIYSIHIKYAGERSLDKVWLVLF